MWVSINEERSLKKRERRELEKKKQGKREETTMQHTMEQTEQIWQ